MYELTVRFWKSFKLHFYSIVTLKDILLYVYRNFQIVSNKFLFSPVKIVLFNVIVQTKKFQRHGLIIKTS